MTLDWALRSVALFAAVGLASSACVGAALALLRGPLARTAPALRARVLFFAALAPGAVVAILIAAALLDAHAASPTPYTCLADFAAEPLGTLAQLLAALLLLRSATALTRAFASCLRTRLQLERLELEPRSGAGGARVLANGGPHAFVAGWLAPRVYITRSLLACVDAETLDAVLRHEAAHARARDPLRRLIARVALTLHLPGLAGWLERALHEAQEMAADDVARRACGDGSRVARALLRVARLSAGTSRDVSIAASFGIGELEARVRALLAPTRGAPLTVRVVLLLTGLALAAAPAAARPLHGLVHATFGWLSL